MSLNTRFGFGWLLVVLSALASDPARAFAPGNSSPDAAELSRRPLPEDEYAESLTVVAYLKDGTRVETGFQVTNLGVGKGNGSFVVAVATPDKPLQARESVGRKFQWDPVAAGGALSISMARKDTQATLRTVAGQTGQPGHQMEVSGISKEFRYKLRFTAEAPAWRPGSGQLQFSDRTLEYFVQVPRARVEAEVEVGGRTVRQTGFGYVEHGRSNVDPRRHTDRQLRLRVFDEVAGRPLTVLAYDHRTPPEDGTRRFGFVVVFLGDQVVYERLTPALTGSEYAPDPLRTKNQVPKGYHVELPELRIKASTQRLVERSDYLEQLSGFIRFVVSRFVHPVSYNYDCTAELQLNLPGKSLTASRTSWADCGISLTRP